MDRFTRATRNWFEDAFPAATDVQQRGWETIASGRNALLVAPTGSGKTLAAFLWAIDQVAQLPGDAPSGVRVLYVSPLKALVYDVERNLRAPLVGIRRSAERLGLAMRQPRVDIRTGDTPQRDRQRQAREPGEILVTTPESLYLLLGSRARQTLATVHTVIVDEVHAVAWSKRGTHLALSLERLSAACGREPQRIGLSATVRPMDHVARFLGGDRPVEIVDCIAPPNLALEVTVPVPDMENVAAPPREDRGGSILGELYAREVGTPPGERGIWPAIYPALLAEIRAHRSTIVFVNSRGLCERLAQRLNELAGEELVRAHHGSVSHQKRAEIEDGLKAGRIKGIVATSSLELGIDMGAVDAVLQVESPGSVARGLQRVGRAGHGVGEVSRGWLFPKFRGDLLECAVIAERMLDGEIESIRIPRNALDVLAQQIVAICCERPHSVEEIGKLVRRACAYRELSEEALQAVLEMLSGHYPSEDFADLKPMLSWDRSTDLLAPRRGSAMLMRMNAGTIPDRGTYGVHLGEDGPRIGELDEEMVYESRAGDTFLLGASTWRIENIGRDRVIVSPAPGEPGRLPFWRGEGPGRPVELGRALGSYVRSLGNKPHEAARAELLARTPLGEHAAENLLDYLDAQRKHTGSLPTDRSITVERFRDELGDWRVCILSPFGAPVHGPWALAIQHKLAERSGFEVQVMYTDDGIVLRFADSEEPPPLALLLPDPEEAEEAVTRELGHSAVFAGLFRENAARALLLPRRRPTRRNPLWAQRLKAQGLLAAVRRYPDFPVVLETYRQILSEVYDLHGLKDLLTQIQRREIEIVDVETASASPFARSLVFAYVAAYLYEQDAPLAERKAQALTLDRGLLSELLGQAELRELIDPQALAELEETLQALAEERQARDADALHDLLRRLGDLSEDELAARCRGDAQGLIEALAAARQAVRVRIAGEQRWIAAEDAGLYRDALGAVPPPGLPESFLSGVDAPLERLVGRYARCHGPFLSREIAARYGLRVAQVEPVLRLLEEQGVLLKGELRPAGSELEWCHEQVLKRLKRATLARLRRQVAPVDARVLGCFLPAWQGLDAEHRGPGRLEEALAQLEGLALPWSLLAGSVLPRRIAGFTLDALDMAAARGQVVWVGRGALGPGDGRVALYRRENIAELVEPEAYEPASELHATLLDTLASRGACFLLDLERLVRERIADVDARQLKEALWDLVWDGQITNDTFQPLRSLGSRGPRRVSGRPGLAPLAGGRWSLVSGLLDTDVPATRRALARARMLLERYGIVSREAAVAESLPGGFGPVYQALKAMEEAGRVRRGYFVEGLAGAQFSASGAVERLRSVRIPNDENLPDAEPEITLLPAADPANPYGALLPWPDCVGAGKGRPRRVAGAWVVLADGEPVLYVAANRRHLLTFRATAGEADRRALAAAFAVLPSLPQGKRRRLLVIETIDGMPVAESPYQSLLLEAGFYRDYRGVIADKRHA